jgi:hypothetical protein
MEDRTINALAGGEPDPAGDVETLKGWLKAAADAIPDEQQVYLEGELVTLSGLSLRLMRVMTKVQHDEARAAFDRGYSGGLRLARSMCDNRDVDLEKVKTWLDRTIESRGERGL